MMSRTPSTPITITDLDRKILDAKLKRDRLYQEKRKLVSQIRHSDEVVEQLLQDGQESRILTARRNKTVLEDRLDVAENRLNTIHKAV